MKAAEFFILLRFLKPSKKGLITSPIVKTALLTIILSTCIVFLAFAITYGFKREVAQKIINVAGHIKISKYQLFENQELTPIEKNDTFVAEIKNLDFVENLSPYINKLALIKTDYYNQGLNFHGIDTCLGSSVLVSKKIKDKLELNIGDKIVVYFISNDIPRPHIFTIADVFETAVDKFDENNIIGDIRELQKVNLWTENQVEGFEVRLKTVEILEIDDFANQINDILPYDAIAMPVTAIYYDIFDWLSLMDANALIILIVISIVASISMMSIFIINIIEKKRHISLLKVIGMKKSKISSIFSVETLLISTLGIILGNILALTLCLLQNNFHLLKLNSSVYYVDYVPTLLNFDIFFIVNASMLFVCIISILIQNITINKVVTNVSYD